MEAIDALKSLDVTVSMEANIKRILSALDSLKLTRKRDGSLSLERSSKTKEIIDLIDAKVDEIEEYYWRPVDSSEVYARLKEIALASSDTERAKKYDGKLKQIEANELEFKGRVNSFYGNNTDALRYYEKALGLVPDHNLARAGKEKAQRSIEKANRSLTGLEKKLASNPNSAKVWYEKGIALLNLDKVEAAIDCFDKAIELEPGYADAWTRKGTALECLGKFKESMQYFEKALKLKPSSVTAKRGLSYAEYFLSQSTGKTAPNGGYGYRGSLSKSI